MNNSKLLNYMKKKPKLYEESSSAFWDDEHISKQMLEAHLNPDMDGASRKHAFIRRSVNWIVQYCNGGDGKKLLDLGCGPGLYTELFAGEGFYVTGIDFSQRSINYAKQRAAENQKNIRYYCQNYLDIDYTNEFDVITLIYCDFGVLPPEDRIVLLRKVHKALKQDGILILDGFTRLFLDTFEEENTVQYLEHGFWAAEPYTVIQRNSLYGDTANTLEQYLIITETGCNCYNLWNQVYSPESLATEIEAGGFRKIEFFDDVAGKPFSGQSETICVAARK
ncbi:class I SAM-dependent methyltransferase [Anaerovorax odorimutans]|uniref:Class I SAM-dependent methyltransferase n=1 Tax=Anaerovorax odorimutans TaxID=109327 RepID=A0ABT1RSE3_9FIRM|nr:class I SAM-dependent methyltransferase [Anaerovorax odorimutans]MCQ4638115.1 class I SAM-dependent methyltransferase [Anaerovorax odorimutans]